MDLFDSRDYHFKTELSQLTQIYRNLPMFVSDYFTELRNKIDIACQYFLIHQSETFSEASIQALDNQVLIIEEIKAFEKICQENLNKINLQEASELIESVETKRIVRSTILAYLSKIKKQIFHNKTYIFLERNSSLLKDTQLAFGSFGALVIVNDEFISDEEFNLTNQIETYDNQNIKKDFFKICLKSAISQEGIQVIYQLYLHLDRVDICDIRSRFIKQINADLFRGINNLVNIDLSQNELTSLEPGTFANLNFLEVINLSHNLLKDINSDILKGLEKLKKLYLNNNKLSKLDSLVFSDLKSLEHIEIYQNFLNDLDFRLFKGLYKLENIGLGQNQLISIDSRTFQDLNNLKYLNLSNNQLTMLSPNIFQSLPELKSIDLGSNQLRLLDPGIFKGLKNLECICLGENCLMMLDYNILQGLDKIKCLYAEGNYIDLETVNFIRNKITQNYLLN